MTRILFGLACLGAYVALWMLQPLFYVMEKVSDDLRIL